VRRPEGSNVPRHLESVDPCPDASEPCRDRRQAPPLNERILQCRTLARYDRRSVNFSGGVEEETPKFLRFPRKNMVRHGVSSEPVSADFPVKQGKYREILRITPESGPRALRNILIFQLFSVEFPTRRNRENYWAEQGILSLEQGIYVSVHL
jgi:hypothetical protein